MRIRKPNSDALYVHIPFCSHLCHYCDFTKRTYDEKTATVYVDALVKELASYGVGKVTTIYVGGGTPTSLTLNQLETLLSSLKPHLKRGGEFTVEGNVENITREKLVLMKAMGVNRLSIGLQTFSDERLKAMNRFHKAQAAIDTIALAKKCGFENLNVDLMYGLPNETLEDVSYDLNHLIELDVDHISCYALSVVPGTLFYRHKIPEAGEDLAREQYDLILKTLRSHGYERYEVSNFARNDHYARHNLVYWDDREYYGIGLGASGYLAGVRYVNTDNMKAYLEGQYRKETEPISPEIDENDFLMLKLRLARGFTLPEFESRYKVAFLGKYQTEVQELTKRGLLQVENDAVRCTDEGIMLLDYVLLKLFKR